MTLPDLDPAGDTELPLAFALPDITEAEIEAVVSVLRSRWLTTGARTSEFETRFAAAVNAPYAVALNSCTAALHLSLEALGIREGDLVFLPPYTFAASGEVIRYLGATPVLVDIDPATFNIDTKALRARILSAFTDNNGRPAAILPVHFSGVACDMDEIWALAREFALAVVEDAAHAFPSEYHGQAVGWMPADIRGTTCYSFYATKTITTGEGGMVTTSDEAVADRIRVMSLHGLSKQAWNRYAGGSWRYDIVAPGYKYNLTDIASALGLAQLSRATDMAIGRAYIAERYSNAFGSLEVFDCPYVPADRVSSWHLYVLRLRAPLGEAHRDQMIDDLKARGIGTSMHFIPLHLHSYYRATYGFKPDDFPVALDTYRRALSLPIYSSMTDADTTRVIDQVLRLGKQLA